MTFRVDCHRIIRNNPILRLVAATTRERQLPSLNVNGIHIVPVNSEGRTLVVDGRREPYVSALPKRVPRGPSISGVQEGGFLAAFDNPTLEWFAIDNVRRFDKTGLVIR